MLHRHLNHQGFTPAAIDDIIERGLWIDWAELAMAAVADGTMLAVLRRLGRRRGGGNRHKFWLLWAEGDGCAADGAGRTALHSFA